MESKVECFFMPELALETYKAVYWLYLERGHGFDALALLFGHCML